MAPVHNSNHHPGPPVHPALPGGEQEAAAGGAGGLSTAGRGSVYELDRQTKCHRTGSVTELHIGFA